MGGSMRIEIMEQYAEEHFFEILEEVQQGQSFTITTDGNPIAQIVPSVETIAKAVERLPNPKITGTSGDTILEWIREGRK